MNLPRRRSLSAPSVPRERRPPSLFSNEIWYGENEDEARAFARDVSIVGWSNVGDKLGGAYVGMLFRNRLSYSSIKGCPVYIQYTTASLELLRAPRSVF